MAEKLVVVGILPEVIAIYPDEQVTWVCDAGTLKIEFDPKRCPFGSNLFQAPAGMQLHSGPPRPGTKSGFYKYSIALNDQKIGTGEVLVRDRP